MAETPAVTVEVGIEGFDAEVRFEDRDYRFDDGEVTCGGIGKTDAGGRNPGVALDGHLDAADAPEIRPGDEVTVTLSYDGRTVEFPAAATKRAAADSAAFKAVRGKRPAGDFEAYEAAREVLERAASDGE